MSDIIAKDTESLNLDSGVISLFEITLQESQITLRLHPENTSEDIIFGGNTYHAFPIGMDKLEITSEGAQTRPSLIIPNVDSILDSQSKFRQLLAAENIPNFKLDDLVGARVTRIKTLSKYIDIGTESVPAPSPYELPKAVYLVDRLASKNDISVELELASPFDLGGTRLPYRNVVGKYCPWLYKGYNASTEDVASACSWTDSNQIIHPEKINGEWSNAGPQSFYFTVDDEPICYLVYLQNMSGSEDGAPPHDPASTYSKDDAVYVPELIDGVTFYRFYLAKADVPANINLSNTLYWQIYRNFTDWDSNTNYYVNSEDSRNSNYVRYNSKVWRTIKNNRGVVPGTDYTVWVEGDVCGKLLSSCKCRFQVVRTYDGTGAYNVPSPSKYDTTITLPFGGFPGTRKFR